MQGPPAIHCPTTAFQRPAQCTDQQKMNQSSCHSTEKLTKATRTVHQKQQIAQATKEHIAQQKHRAQRDRCQSRSNTQCSRGRCSAATRSASTVQQPPASVHAAHPQCLQCPQVAQLLQLNGRGAHLCATNSTEPNLPQHTDNNASTSRVMPATAAVASHSYIEPAEVLEERQILVLQIEWYFRSIHPLLAVR